MLEQKVSLYSNAKDNIGKEVQLQSILDAIKNGKWEKSINKIRSLKTDEDRKKHKPLLPCFTGSGTFIKRGKDFLSKHNGLIIIDIDYKDNKEKVDIKNTITKDEYSCFVFKSCGGLGFAVGVKIKEGLHERSFVHLENYYLSKYNIKIDNCSDVSRLRFVSFDKELYINENSKTFEFQETERETSNQYNHQGMSDENNKYIMESIISSGRLIGDDSYPVWCDIGFALATEFGEYGREYFHALSSKSNDKYSRDVTDKKYDNFLSTNKGSLKFGTIVALAKQAGISLYSRQSKLAEYTLNNKYKEKFNLDWNEKEIKEYLSHATITEDTSIVKVSDIFEEIDSLYKTGFKRGLSTGWNSIDSHYTVRPGEVTIITGIPSHGKSTWTSNLITNIANHYGWKFAVFSPENAPLSRYAAHIMQIYTKKPFDIRCADRMTEGEKEYSKEWIDNHFVFIKPNDDELYFSNILKKALVCITKHGVSGIVIDPWNEIDHTRPAGLSETEYISKCLSKLRYFARTYNVHIWLVAHPTKMPKNPDGGYSVPTPYDISGSSHFRNKADCCITIYRKFSEGEELLTEVHIQKIRFHEVGSIGMVKLKYNKIIQSFEVLC